jgi:hypothetical protein
VLLLLDRNTRESFPKPRPGIKIGVFPSRQHDLPCQIYAPSAVLWNEAIACSLPWVDYNMAALTSSSLPPIGQITNDFVKRRSRWPIRVVRSFRPSRGQLSAQSLLYTSSADPCECLGLHLSLKMQYYTPRIWAVIPHRGSGLCRQVQAWGNNGGTFFTHKGYETRRGRLAIHMGHLL